jgi:hypothetical protein
MTRRRVANCSDCGVGITALALTGRCRRCALAICNADPDAGRKRSEGMLRRHAADPAEKARRAKIMNRNREKAMTDPAVRAKLSAIGHANINNLLKPETRAKILATRAQAGKAYTELKLGWCPPDLRAEYKRLYRGTKLTSADARAIIEQKIADREALREIDAIIHFMRRLAPIARCNEQGKPDPTGSFFRFGNTVLTPGELMRRAEARGYGERMAA